MHDEATAHFIDMIDQTALGHAFIASEFGVYPTVGSEANAESGWMLCAINEASFLSLAASVLLLVCCCSWQIGQTRRNSSAPRLTTEGDATRC